jgi:hypothetical protein
VATIAVDGRNLKLTIPFFESLQALQVSFEIPLENITEVFIDNGFLKKGIGLRAPGTAIPGFIARGTFRRKGVKSLVLWKRGQEILVIKLINSKFDQIVLGCLDADQRLSAVMKVLRG